MKHLALVDLDGTLYQGDSMLDFIAFAKGRYKLHWYLLCLLPGLILMKLRLLDPGIIKKKLLQKAFKGQSKETLFALGNQFASEVFPKKINHTVLQQITQPETTLVIVSASLDYWVTPIADALQATTIATIPVYKDNRYDGDFASPNCKKEEKVHRIKACITLTKYDTITAYGNSADDIPMLQIADKAYWTQHNGTIVPWSA